MAFLYSTCLYVSISCLEIKVGYEYRSSVKYIHLISAHSNIDSCVKKGFEERKRNGRYSDPLFDYLTLDCYCSCSSFKAKKIKEDYSITRLHPRLYFKVNFYDIFINGSVNKKHKINVQPK